MAHHVLVVGGNGFLGSAVCKTAVAKGWKVTSISKSGKPYLTPSGHAPAWTSQVAWNAASASESKTYSHLLPGVTAVVHTLGILLENNYKSGVRGALSALWASRSPNPLMMGGPGSYEAVNRDSALTVLEAFSSTSSEDARTFAYISAADVFRPLIPERYISTKREAEQAIEQTCQASDARLRGLYFRPGLMYHPHIRPLTTPIASLLDLSASLSASIPSPLPSPARILRSIPFGGSPGMPPPTHSMANALETRPMHVESVARAICVGIERQDVSGVVDVSGMRELLGWEERVDAMRPREPMETDTRTSQGHTYP